jgi:hypothetical protein
MNEPTPNQEPRQSANEDQYWWAPWAVLVGLVLLGALGVFGVLTPKRSGPSAADVPVTMPSAERPQTAQRPPTPQRPPAPRASH